MKKILALAIISVSSIFFASSVEAKSTNVNTIAENSVTAPQVRVRVGRNRRARVVTQTRNVRRGRNLYRETYQTRYRANGAVTTRLISRVLIRRY